MVYLHIKQSQLVIFLITNLISMLCQRTIILRIHSTMCCPVNKWKW